MIREAIYHVVDSPYAFAVDNERLKIRIRTKKNDICECCIYYADRYEYPLGKEESSQLEKIATDEYFDYYETTIILPKKRVRYKFFLKDFGGESIWYGEDGFDENSKTYNYFQMPYLCEQDVFEIPEWCKDSIVYQIYPQSFCNGDISNDPEGVADWDTMPEVDTFYGGDLQGVIEKIPYLVDLGINTIYFTPIFKAASPHKYDTIDYLDIDPSFGDFELFKTMVDKLHQNGIKIILDAVFTFCGYEFYAFQDVVKNGKESKYLDWFNVYSLPITKKPTNYETFVDGIWMLPKIYKKNKEARDYLLKVSKFWIEKGNIDGWRLDTANEVEHDFWKDFRKVVKGVNKNTIIIGEVWHNSSPWLRGDEFDSVMNYKFQLPIIKFIAEESISVEKFDNLLTKARMNYQDQANYAGFNLLDSHDTERFLSVCKEDKNKLKLAAIFQLTYLGQPMIYYGDEVGMTGKKDPDCRRPMIWDKSLQDMQIFELYKKLIFIRKNNKALTHGNFRTWFIGNGSNIYGFKRSYEDKTIAIILNNGIKEQELEVEINWNKSNQTKIIDLLNETEYSLHDNRIKIVLSPYGAVILA